MGAVSCHVNCLHYVKQYDMYLLNYEVNKVDLSCNDEIMKIVNSDAYCGSLINSTGPFADCLAKMVRNTFVKSQQKPNSSALCVSLCPTGRK